MDISTGFTLEEGIDEASLTVTPLLKTSDRGYLIKTADSLSNVNSSNSKKGEYILGAVSEKAVDGGSAKLIAYSASATFDVNAEIQTDLYMNADLFMNSIYWACDVDESAAISIPTKSFESTMVTMEGSDVIFIVLTFLILIPIIILVLGFIVWIRRRRR
jgi:ABC-2 type transport system permease protein